MKNKNAQQRDDRIRHRESLRAKRRSEPGLERDAPSITETPTILIVCEGKNTEPSYFNHFRLASAKAVPIGEGYNTISLVNRAIELALSDVYDQVWCVFDKDANSDYAFNEAIRLAEENNFGVAYSNQAFEYWLILHFLDHQGGGMSRGDYNKKINKLLMPYHVKYEGFGSKIVTEDFFELLFSKEPKQLIRRVDNAINRAERNYNQFDHRNPAKEESSTTVFRLVKELLKYGF